MKRTFLGIIFVSSIATASCFAQQRITELGWSNFNAIHTITNPTNVTVWKGHEIQLTLFLTNREVVIGETNILQYQVKNLSTNLIKVATYTDDHTLRLMNSRGDIFPLNPEDTSPYGLGRYGSKEIGSSYNFAWSKPLVIRRNIKPDIYTLKATRLLLVYFPTNGTHPTGYILKSEPLMIKAD